MSELCRICLFDINPPNFVNVYLRTAHSVAIIDVMKECSSIQVMDQDDLPKFICTNCVEKLNFVYGFRNLIISSDMRLKMQLQYNKRLIAQNDTVNNFPNEHLKLNFEEIEIKEETIETLIPPQENTAQSEVLEDRYVNTGNVTSEEKRYKCRECEKTFNSWNSFKKHEMEHKGVTPFSCEFCNKGFHTKWTLKVHTRIHTGCKPYTCDVCQKKFRIPSALIIHKRIHAESRKYRCNFCDKGFNQSTGLNVHMRIHTGERPYMCETCGKTFTDTSSFIIHKGVHQAKELPCFICGKIFKDEGSLQAHVKRHSGLKPHTCEKCGKAFTVASSLKIHKNTIHFGIKAHKCKVCEKSFSQNSTLVKHMLTHSGEKPFPCTLCPKEFAYKHHLQSHVRKHHENVTETKLNND